MSALGLYGSLILICAISALVGQAVFALCGRRSWTWIAPAVGMAVLILAAGLTIRLPGRGTTAALAVVVLLVLALLVLWRRRPEGIREAARAGLPIAIAVAAAASLPFAAAGGIGELGVLVNNDLGIHLQNADWLRTHAGPEPTQVGVGYPVGPHALVVAVAELTGAGLREVFTALLIAVPVLVATASMAMLASLPTIRRALAAILVALAYLAASFYVQSAFKETLMGLFVLAFALALRELTAEWEARAGTSGRPAAVGVAATIRRSVPLALLVGAGIQVYSYPGMYWAAGTAALWALGVFAASGGLRTPGAALRPLWPLLSPLAAGAAILIAITAPALARITNFAESQDASFGGTFGQFAIGNLYGPLPPEEVIGIWFSSDLRFAPPSDAVASGLGLLAVVALGVAVVRLVLHREVAVLAALVTTGVIYLGTRAVSSDYVQSKALTIAAPIVMLSVLAGLLERAREGRGARGGPIGERARRFGIRVRDFVALAGPRELASLGRSILAMLFVAAALFSTYLVLGGAPVGPELRSAELPDLRDEIEDRRVVFLAFGDDYSDYELRGTASLLEAGSARTSLPRRFDFDSVPQRALAGADVAIAPRGSFASEPPTGYRPAGSTEHFIVWERVAPTEARRTLGERRPPLEGSPPPGRALDCNTRSGRELSGQTGEAGIFATPPVVGPFDAWSESAALPKVAGAAFGSPDVQILTPGMIAIDPGMRPSQTLRLSPGRWQISLQYVSPHELVLEAPGLRHELPPMIDSAGPFWPAGSLRVARRGPVTFTVSSQRPSFVRRVLEGPQALRTRPETTIGAIAATREEPRRTLPLRDACGEVVDWYRLRGTRSDTPD